MIKYGVWYRVKERVRVYHFPTGTVQFLDVMRFRCSLSGVHFLETKSGKHIVNTGWTHISLIGEWIKR